MCFQKVVSYASSSDDLQDGINFKVAKTENETYNTWYSHIAFHYSNYQIK